MEHDFGQWWRVAHVTDREGETRCRHPFLLEDKCYAYGLHVEHYDAKRTVFCWEIVRDMGKYTVWDNFTTSTIENIEEKEDIITVTTKNSVYYFKKIDTPDLPDGTEEEWFVNTYKQKEEKPVSVTPTMYGKLLVLRANQLNNSPFKKVDEIIDSLSTARRLKIRSDFSIVDFIKENYDPDACIETTSEWLATRAVAFRENADRSGEKDFYLNFFTYTLQMLTKGDVLSSGIDDLIKMAEVLEKDYGIYLGTVSNCVANTQYDDILLDAEEWLGDEPEIPRDFEVYVLAAVAAFTGSLPDPISINTDKE